MSETEKLDTERALFVGIDLGTTNSVISFWDPVQEKPVAFGTEYGRFIMPSVLSYDDREKRWVIGEAAVNKRETFPEVTVSSIKRQMGEEYETPSIGGRPWKPVELSELILKSLASFAEGAPRGRGPVPGSWIHHAVVCHPYDFNNEALKRTREAAVAALPQAGPERVVLLEEPTAAALGYELLPQLQGEETVLVFDLGGGTFDITVFKTVLTEDRQLTLQVLALEGDERLGGDDFDQVLMNHLSAEWAGRGVLKDDLKTDTPRTRKLRQYLRKTAEDTKIFLADAQAYSATLLDPDDPFSEPVTLEITQAKFNSLADDLFERVKQKCVEAIKAAQAQEAWPSGKTTVDHVLLVGGSTNMARVKEVVLEVFGKLPSAPYDKATIVSRGAAVYSAVCGGLTEGREFKTLPFAKVRVENIVPHPIGVQARMGTREVFKQVFAKGTRFPVASRPMPFHITGENDQEVLRIWEVRSGRLVDLRPIDDIKNNHKGMLIGKVTFTGTKGLPRKVMITLEVAKGGTLAGKYVDPKGGGGEQTFDIGRFIDSSHRL